MKYKIKCKNKADYEIVRNILVQEGIPYKQKNPVTPVKIEESYLQLVNQRLCNLGIKFKIKEKEQKNDDRLMNMLERGIQGSSYSYSRGIHEELFDLKPSKEELDEDFPAGIHCADDIKETGYMFSRLHKQYLQDMYEGEQDYE